MAESMRSFYAVFLVAMLSFAMVFAATPTLESCCPDETSGLAVIGHGDVAAMDGMPAGVPQLRPRLHGVEERMHRAAGLRHAVMGDPAPTMQVSSPRQISIRACNRSWIDDPKVLTQVSPRGPPSV